MSREELLESLVVLYLRLNGYFTTGLIIHSDDARSGNRSEVDVLSVRFPRHRQPERLVSIDQNLGVPNSRIDIVIGEVKSGTEQLQFNRGLRDSAEAIASLLRWVGLFDDDTIAELVPKVRAAMTPGGSAEPVEADGVQLRPLLFAPDRTVRRPNQVPFVSGEQMMAYLRTCFCPDAPRPECMVRYDFGLWGQEFEPIVRYFKARGVVAAGDVDDLVEKVLGDNLGAAK